MKSLPDVVRSARRVRMFRAIGWPVYKLYRIRTASGVANPILINSIPKAGTHLIASVLSKVPGIEFSGQIVSLDSLSPSPARVQGEMPDYDAAKLRALIDRIAPGTFANCHVYYDELTRTLLAQPSVSSVFVVRDPRDILVSLLNYIEQFSGHHSHSHLISAYATRTERIDALIYGWEASGSIRGMADYGTRLRAYRGWSQCLPTFKYEEFSAPIDSETLDRSLHRLLDASGVSALCDVESVRSGIGDKWSATFNTARVGEWSRILSKRQVDAVERLAFDYFDEHGYS